MYIYAHIIEARKMGESAVGCNRCSIYSQSWRR